MTSLQDLDLEPFIQDTSVLTSALTTGLQESVRILSSALFDTSSDLTTTFFTVLLMVLTATMVRMMLEGRTTPEAELEKRKTFFIQRNVSGQNALNRFNI